jgi:uncharacterized membrane protein
MPFEIAGRAWRDTCYNPRRRVRKPRRPRRRRPPDPHPSPIMLRWLIRCFLAGLFTILPLVITAAIVFWVADYLSRWLGPGTPIGRVFENVGLRVAGSNTVAYLVGWIVVLGVVFGLGVLVESGARRWIQDRLDRVLGRVPMLGSIYGTVRQLVGMMDAKGSPDLQGMSVVYCVFGSDNGAAFLALLATPERVRIGDVEYHAVIIPSAPVPVTGSLLFVPVASVRPAGISVDAFMSVYVSMGVTGPQFLRGATGKSQSQLS